MPLKCVHYHYPSRKPWFNSPVALPRHDDSERQYDSQDTGLKNDAHYEGPVKEISRTLVGPIPIDQFLQRFLPIADREFDSSMPPCTDAFKEVPHEGNLYGSLVYALNGGEASSSSRLCSGIKFGLGHCNGHLRSEDRVEDTIYAYSSEDVEHENFSGIAQLLVNLHADDPACDTFNGSIRGDVNSGSQYDSGFETRAKEVLLKSAHQALGQQVSLASEIFAQQHRNFLFSILMTPTGAAFLYWDHAGATISSSFDYRSQPEILCKFLWRFGYMTDAQRGSDTTGQTTNKTEERIFAEAIKAHVRAQLGDNYKEPAEEYRRHYQPGRVVKIPVRKRMRIMPGNNAPNAKERVEFDYGEEVVEFLVSRPVASPRSVVSSATRGYWAVDVKTKAVHFLKDAWRTVVRDMEIEGRILEKLALKKVRNVPTILYWSDVGPADNNDAHKHDDWNKHLPDNHKMIRLARRVHYRQVTAEAGCTLEQLMGTYELLKGTHDVFEALRDAHTLCNRLHRDISSTNVILFADPEHSYSERRAILADWELSCEDVESPTRDHWISGTWAFMSINTLSLSKVRRRHHASDDVESLIYVIFYCAVHFLQWKQYDSVGHGVINKHFFHQQNIDDTGGESKKANLTDAGMFGRAEFDFVSDWLDASLPLMALYVRNIAKATAEMVYEAYNPLFNQEETYWTDLPKHNREEHKLVYKGPPRRDIPRAPTVSSHHTSSIISLEDEHPVKSSDEGSSSKRDLASIEQPVFEFSTKRQKTDEGQGVTAAPKKVASNMKKRSAGRVKAAPKWGHLIRNLNMQDPDGCI